MLQKTGDSSELHNHERLVSMKTLENSTKLLTIFVAFKVVYGLARLKSTLAAFTEMQVNETLAQKNKPKQSSTVS